jgi:hypothetical protein
MHASENATPPAPAVAESTCDKPIEGRWRLKQVIDTRIPAMAFRLIYTFNDGQGSFEKDGKPSGDGFSYTVASGKITLEGAGGEGLVDAGHDERHYSHYYYTISGREMSWWVHDSAVPDDRRILYVFERAG